MSNRIRTVLLTAVLASSPAFGANEAHDQGGANEAPIVGSQQRRAILDALRPAVAREMRGPVEFVVERLDVRSGWALVWAQPQRPGGGRIDPQVVLTPEQLEFSEGIRVDALLRFEDEQWKVEDYRVGATDVWYACYAGAPPVLTGCTN